ncbi:hypothetical protein [Nocardioides nitrophenolicus]|uniref:hypothetical protein n=1 Tax=Nocardioides nitrophenolicus TaxID=60489 RepID=UPI001956E75A|nr:hypothetical protein [Nocardioides nitrophenolicus]MBM7516151.1 hypothetical protein [Nocardioides nitrophenolicus]
MSYPPPPPPPPPYAQTWPVPGGPPPKRPRTGLTLALLAGGLVLVLGVIGVVALVVRGDDSEGDDAREGAHQASCEVYTDVVLNSEIWAATEFDPDKVQEVYDAALADITDDEVAALVEEEATVKVSYYRALREWKQDAEDALSRGEYPETTLPPELTAQGTEIQGAQRAVLEECQDTFPDRGNQPVPKVTAPTLEKPSSLDQE